MCHTCLQAALTRAFVILQDKNESNYKDPQFLSVFKIRLVSFLYAMNSG